MLQLKKSVSLRSLPGDLRNRLDLAAGMGAEGVEIDVRNELPLDEMSRTAVRQVLKWLADRRLKVAALSYPTRRGLDDTNHLEQRMDGIRRAMTLASSMGCRLVSSQGHPLPDRDSQEFRMLVGVLSDLTSYSIKAGAWLAIRTAANNGTAMAELLKEFPDGSLQIDFDPAALLLFGHNPVQTMEEIGSSVAHFRARDAVRDRTLPGGGTEVQLGRGTVDVPSLLARLEENGYDGYVTIERNNEMGPNADDCKSAMQYLENLFS